MKSPGSVRPRGVGGFFLDVGATVQFDQFEPREPSRRRCGVDEATMSARQETGRPFEAIGRWCSACERRIVSFRGFTDGAQLVRAFRTAAAA